MDGHKSPDEAEGAPQNTSVADTTMDSAVHNGSQNSAAVEANRSNDSQQEASTTSTAAESAGADANEVSANKDLNGNARGANPRGRGRGRGGFRGSPRQYNNPRPPFRRGGSENNVGHRRHELLEVIKMQHMKVLIYTSSSDLTPDERQAGVKAARHAFETAMEEWTTLGFSAVNATDAAAQSALNAVAAATDAPAYVEAAPPSPEAPEA